MSKNIKIVESIIMERGMEIDIDEGWRKLINRQFGGDPGRGFSELIQNFLDGYSSDTPWENRIGEIKTTGDSISITDYGEGMNRERLKLIVTLGGTDKNNDQTKIGTFGIGFFSIFNQKLGTKKVSIITRCEDWFVELVFNVKVPGKRPEIKTMILKKTFKFSTHIKIFFDNSLSSEKCLLHAQKSLKYYPCKVIVNGHHYKSIWEVAGETGAYMFENRSCKGFLKKSTWRSRITILCKFEYIMSSGMAYLLVNRYKVKNDLRDFAEKEIPYIPDVDITINSNTLNVTISRDSFMMDDAYRQMIDVIREELFKYMLRNSPLLEDRDLILANHYVLRKKLHKYLYKDNYKGIDNPETRLLDRLVHAKVYRLNGHKDHYSLSDIKDKLSDNLPLFYSVTHTNLRWLGGDFKHDFIVLPLVCKKATAPLFFYSVFKEIYLDLINLDTVKDNTADIKALVDRGIINKSALSMTCSILGSRSLNDNEAKLLKEIDDILVENEIRTTVKNTLFIKFRKISTAFFDIERAGAVIATGLFDETGKALDEMQFQNLNYTNNSDNEGFDPEYSPDIILGLQRNHPFINQVIVSNDPNRIYYMLTFLAHELALCQKLLVPYSPFYHMTKERLATGMRKAMMNRLLNEKA